mmetsp:Transcript_31219/g.93578  ORF Transcript_31219/g.93578 Transcript_31219/m.93578 type:complete len:205 (-) Transcript_31219:245-859(-)|eukprot:CAMPEP_0113554322 /NCGR_PEP_ID=MMETSP0015_2-20120614/16086_1 /TAXON_ID=2838 /ORGANISM="Odontella" /LENGTH=204 /DNA_ID=CAMNT_0000455453 /DNA_START=118 /DNA_END=732 /DNA_ORIENTATION=+ /assembly_acc=CAM_ASM_000160
MSIVSIALVGKRGEPLFAQEFKSRWSSLEGDADVGVGHAEDIDFFGFDEDGEVGFGAAGGTGGRAAAPYDCSLRQQLILHSALDRFDELTAPGVRRPNTPAAGTPASDAMWLGLLCPVDDLRVYGYLTTTKVRIVAAIEDSFLPDEAQRQKSREAKIKNLVAKVHSLYVEHTLNPFAAAGRETMIESRRFHDGVKRLVGAFNMT